jgi:hypothetical protein
MGSHLVTIGGIGWTDEQVVPASRIGFSRVVDAAGTLECAIPKARLAATGYKTTGSDDPIKGRWLRFAHGTAGEWAGVITQTRADGYWIVLTAESFHVLLRKRVVPLDYGVMSAPAGALALRALSDVQRGGEYLWLSSRTADENGQPLDYEWRGGDLVDDVLRELVDASGYQWTVTPDRAFQFRKRLGEDKSGSVCLVEGQHISVTETTGDLWTLVNVITAVTLDSTWRRSDSFQTRDDDSIQTFGRRYEATQEYPLAARSTLAPIVRERLDALSAPAEAVRLEVVDVGNAWADVRAGDRISAVLPSINAVAQIEVMAQSFDLDRGLMSLACRMAENVTGTARSPRTFSEESLYGSALYGTGVYG